MKNKILIVDDCLSSRDALKTIVESVGFVPAIEEDGAGAIRCLGMEHQSIALVLLDIYMPQIDGISALGHIRGHYPELPVIIITGGGDSEDEATVRKLGAVAFIQKPYPIEAIRSAIHQALNPKERLERSAI
jgi:DNA-binding NtrC family response regulator